MKGKEFQINEFKNSLKLKLSTISGAFMLPIATMAIVQFFLSVGGVISGMGHDNWWGKVGAAISSLSSTLLQTFPILLCISFTVSFNKKELGISIWCSLLAFLTFIYFQSAFISFSDTNFINCCKNGTGCCNSNKQHCNGLSCLCHAPQAKMNILFNAPWRTDQGGILKRILGVLTLNTSIFGPIFIGGFLIPHIIKKYSDIKLPTYLSYFSGRRLLPLISCLAVIPVALFFLVFWPWIGTGLSLLGNLITRSQGVDSFFFGLFEKLLIPTGLHHIFASLFWYSPLGGDVSAALIPQINLSNNECSIKELCCGNQHNGLKECCSMINNSGWSTGGALLHSLSPAISNSLPLEGDALIGSSILSLPGHSIGGSTNIFEFLKGKGIHAGRFTQGKFPIMQFALPAAALAIYLNRRKKDKNAGKNIFPGIWNSLILGITEPIEFSFMHKFPKLFHIFHAGMCGISFLAMRLLNAHITTSFSGGIIELFINGVIPVNKGTNFWWWAIVGSSLALIYFIVFYIAFWKFDEEGKTEGVVNNQKQGEEQEGNDNLPPNISFFKKGLGGWDNVATYKNCASRLRYDIKDKTKVNEENLKKAGVIAIKWIGDQHVQLIVGPKAEEINSELIKYAQKEGYKN